MAREEKLVVKLEERMKFQFQQYADKFGVTMSALGAFVIGQWVDGQNRLNQTNERVVGDMVMSVQERVNGISVDESIEAFMKNQPLVESLIKAMVSAGQDTKAQALAVLDTERDKP